MKITKTRLRQIITEELQLKQKTYDDGEFIHKEKGQFEVYDGDEKVGEVWKGLDRWWHTSVAGTTTQERYRKRSDAVDSFLGGTGAGSEKPVFESTNKGDKMKVTRRQLRRIIKEEMTKVLSESAGSFTYNVIEDEFDGGPAVEIEGISVSFEQMIQSLEGQLLDFGDEPPFEFSLSLFGDTDDMIVNGVAGSYIEMWAEMNGYEAQRTGVPF